MSQRPPLGRLADGTPYFAPLGQLPYDRDIDRVQCHLCGQWFLALAPGHLRLAHGWTHEEYKSAFGLSKNRPLQIPRLLKRRRRVMLRMLRTNQVMRQALEDAQGKMRSGALLERARLGLQRPLPMDQRQRSIEAAARGTALWQRQSDLERVQRVRILGFTSVGSYLHKRYISEGWALKAIKDELVTGQSTLRRLTQEAGIEVRVDRRRWSVHENRRLLAMFDRRMTDEDLATALRRSVSSVKSRRLSLGLRLREPRRRWTAIDEKRLRAGHRRGESDAEIATALRRRVRAVKVRRQQLRLVKLRGVGWTRREEGLLRTLYQERRTDEEIAQVLDRTPLAIHHRRQQLGLVERRRLRWSDSEDQQLRDLVSQGLTNEEIARAIGHPRAAVSYRLHQLRVTRRELGT